MKIMPRHSFWVLPERMHMDCIYLLDNYWVWGQRHYCNIGYIAVSWSRIKNNYFRLEDYVAACQESQDCMPMNLSSTDCPFISFKSHYRESKQYKYNGWRYLCSLKLCSMQDVYKFGRKFLHYTVITEWGTERAGSTKTDMYRADKTDFNLINRPKLYSQAEVNYESCSFTVRSNPDFQNTNEWNRTESHDCSELFWLPRFSSWGSQNTWHCPFSRDWKRFKIVLTLFHKITFFLNTGRK